MDQYTDDCIILDNHNFAKTVIKFGLDTFFTENDLNFKYKVMYLINKLYIQYSVLKKRSLNKIFKYLKKKYITREKWDFKHIIYFYKFISIYFNIAYKSKYIITDADYYLNIAIDKIYTLNLDHFIRFFKKNNNINSILIYYFTIENILIELFSKISKFLICLNTHNIYISNNMIRYRCDLLYSKVLIFLINLFLSGNHIIILQFVQ